MGMKRLVPAAAGATVPIATRHAAWRLSPSPRSTSSPACSLRQTPQILKKSMSYSALTIKYFEIFTSPRTSALLDLQNPATCNVRTSPPSPPTVRQRPLTPKPHVSRDPPCSPPPPPPLLASSSKTTPRHRARFRAQGRRAGERQRQGVGTHGSGPAPHFPLAGSCMRCAAGARRPRTFAPANRASVLAQPSTKQGGAGQNRARESRRLGGARRDRSGAKLTREFPFQTCEHGFLTSLFLGQRHFPLLLLSP